MLHICSMNSSDKEIELAWIHDVLERRGEKMIDVFRKAIQEQQLVRSGALLGSLNYKVEGSDSADAILSIIFNKYGRFRDMGAPLKPKAKKEDNIPLLGRRTNGKARKWYARNLYRELDRLIYDMIYGLDQGTKEILREQLNNLNKNSNESSNN